MAIFKVAPAGSRSRLVKKSNSNVAKNDELYGQVFSALKEHDVLVLVPAEGETLRGVRSSLGRAAKRAGVKVLAKIDGDSVLVALAS